MIVNLESDIDEYDEIKKGNGKLKWLQHYKKYIQKKGLFTFSACHLELSSSLHDSNNTVSYRKCFNNNRAALVSTLHRF